MFVYKLVLIIVQYKNLLGGSILFTLFDVEIYGLQSLNNCT